MERAQPQLVRRHDIYLIRITLRECFDHRPCIVLYDASNEPIEVALLSSALDLYRPGLDFLIDQKHPEFSNTGLGRSSYVVEGKVREVQMDQLTTYLGKLTGTLASSFDEWAGFSG